MQDKQQIYGRNDMVMLEKHNKIYGSLGLTEPFVFDTIKGENRVVLKNPKEGNFENVITNFTLQGKSQQNSTTGKNLLSNDVLNRVYPYIEKGVAIDRNEDGTLSLHGTVDAISNLYINFPIFNVVSGRKYTGQINQANIRLITKGSLKMDVRGNEKEVTVSATATGPIKNVYLVIESGKTVNYDSVAFMIEEGEVASPYEPYTGGKPSPSPDYPQEIKNVGDKGNVGVSVTGKNLLPNTVVLPDKTDKGITWTYKSDGVYHIKGTSKDFFDSPILPLSDFNLPPGTYRMINSGNAIPQIVTTKRDGRDVWYASKFTIEEGDKIKYWYCVVEKERTVDTDVYVYLELDAGREPHKKDFEPYKPVQSIDTPIQNGLLGIKVESGGNYTDENGQQWICDEIDLERGKYVQRVKKHIFGNNDSFLIDTTLSDKLNRFSWCEYQKDAKVETPIICNIFKFSGFTQLLENNTIHGAIRLSRCFIFVDKVIDSEEKFKSLIDGKECFYVLQSPIETDLPQEVIEQYKKLKTYYPTTVITVDGGELPVGVEVTYKQVSNG